MNKIKNLLKGSPITIVIAVLLIAGVASAALVNYLSNHTAIRAYVASPIEMSVNPGADGTATGNRSISIGTTGGSDFTFTIVAKNNANNEISGYPVIVVVAPGEGGFTGKEITRVMFGLEGTWPGMVDITNHLRVVGPDGLLHELSKLPYWAKYSKRLVLVPQASPRLIAAGATKWGVFTITLAQNIAPGTYRIYSQYASDLADYAYEQYRIK